MASSNRADRIEHFYKALRKHYKPATEISERRVLDHLLYACCLEDASVEAADEAFAKLQQAYFDSNEIRVTTVAELSESLTSLPKAHAAASRIKRSLQSLFEARFTFDIDDLKKTNLGKALEEIVAWQGTSRFVTAYVTQHALGGHSVPFDNQSIAACIALDLLTFAEAEKGSIPGIERAIPKTKGLEFSSLLQQFGVEYTNDPQHPIIVAVFKEMGVPAKPRVIFPPPPPPPPPRPPEVKHTAVDAKGNVKAAATAKDSALIKKGAKDVTAKDSSTTKPVDTRSTLAKEAAKHVNPKGKTEKPVAVEKMGTKGAKPDAKRSGDKSHPAEQAASAGSKGSSSGKPSTGKPGVPTSMGKEAGSKKVAAKPSDTAAGKTDNKSSSKMSAAKDAKAKPATKPLTTKGSLDKSADSKSKLDKSKTDKGSNGKSHATTPDKRDPKTSIAKGLTKKVSPMNSSSGKNASSKDPAAKSSSKPASKPGTSKPKSDKTNSSKSNTSKPLTKSGSHKLPPSSKSTNGTKRLPVKPVTKKKTKPR